MEQPPQPDDMLQLLMQRFAEDSEGQIVARLRRSIADPLKPLDEMGNIRLSPVVVVLLIFGLIGVSTFLYFGYWA